MILQIEEYKIVTEHISVTRREVKREISKNIDSDNRDFRSRARLGLWYI